MSVGILLVTHPGIGTALVAAATRLLGRLPLATAAYELPFDMDATGALPQASAAMRTVAGSDGVLMLVDLYGATPSNLAAQLGQLGTPARRVAGLNLPMLLRVMNYPENDLDGLQSVASVGGRNGVVLDGG